MRLFIFGAGAIGGYLAGELALVGHEVYAIVRGPLLAAIRGIHWFRPVYAPIRDAIRWNTTSLSVGFESPASAVTNI
jgi:nucleoside-diphosphate-sugar epimerase